LTTALATLIAVCAFAVIVSAIAVYQTRRYTSAIIATIFQPEARMSSSASLDDSQSNKVSIAVVSRRGKPNTKDGASWSSSDTSVVSLSAVNPDPTKAGTADPLGREMWLIGEDPGTAAVTVVCAGGTLVINVSVSASPTSITATIDAPVDVPPPAAPAA
jgi:hypothetical protein